MQGHRFTPERVIVPAGHTLTEVEDALLIVES
jgi:hypothetical protein